MDSIKVFPFLLVVLLTVGISSSRAQDVTPPIENFTSVDYKAGRQNWGIAIDEQGIVYTANHKGLLVFDGQRWELLPLKNNAIIRSVFAHRGRIYTGSYQEFGFWERNQKGKYCYTSLLPLLENYQMQSEEIWQILSFGDKVYFRSFGAIYKYDGKKVSLVKNLVTNEMIIYRDRLLVAKGNDGLFFLNEDGSLEALPHQEMLEGKTILDIEVQGEELLIGTRNRLYQYEGGRCKVYQDEQLNQLLNRYELNHLLKFSNQELVIGTVKSGIIHYYEESGEYLIYNRSKGLQNNTVLGMTRKNGRLWLALDNGIDAIDLHSPIRFFRDHSGELGSVYDLALHNGRLFVASNTGVYHWGAEGIQMIAGAEGHCWNLELLDSVLYANHNNGTYTIRDGNFEPITERTGSFQVHKLNEDRLLLGTYNGIETYAPASGELRILNDARFPVRQLVYEDDQTLWATHAYEGIYRIKLNASRDSILSVTNYDPNPEGSYNVQIFRIKHQLLAYINGKWYQYNSFQDRLEPFEDLERMRNHRFLGYHQPYFWFINERDHAIVVTDLAEEELIIAQNMLDRRLVRGNERVIRENDSIFYSTLQDGYAKLNFNELIRRKNKGPVQAPILRSLASRTRSFDLGSPSEISFEEARELVFYAGLPLANGHSLIYQLNGEETLTGKVEQGRITFRNLAPGDYELELMGASPQQLFSEVVTHKFHILPPWYFSTAMKLVYLLLLLAIGFLIYKLNRLKLKKHRRILEEKYEKEHREHLYKLEKRNLMEEIDLKRKELANSTLMAAKKNEVLLEIQGELTRNRKNLEEDYRMKQILKRITRAINNRDEWKVFETNFNEVHEDFFKGLLEQYPQLTNRDLKLCSYLKMNLSSKEIAPLLGITIRGVEVQRYRLRKKMGLDPKENLNNFLIANF